jgi:hypothetical protein
VGQECGAKYSNQILAQVISNEVEARLGGSCLLGPLNGQLWSFIHAAGSAAATAKLLGLSRNQMANALAISLWNANRPTVPGFMAPDTKLFTASDPIEAGIRAAYLAAANVTGPLDLLDHSQGFFSVFTYTPIKKMISRLGESWATKTLSVKSYPGCAYIDTVIDALAEIGPIDPDDIDNIEIRASLLTCEMNELSIKYRTGQDIPTPINVTFSVELNVAIMILAGELSPRQVNSSWLEQNMTQIKNIAGKVSLKHDWSLTNSVMKAFSKLVPPSQIFSGNGIKGILRTLDGNRRSGSSLIALPDLKTLPSLLKIMKRSHLISSGEFWDPESIENFAMEFPAVVNIKLKTNGSLSHRVDNPSGGAGNKILPPSKVALTKATEWLGPDVILAIENNDPNLWNQVAGMIS